MLGLTLPLEGYSLPAHRSALRELVDVGYTHVWAGEADGLDAVVPLAAAVAWEPSLHVGTAIVPSFTRGPGVLAMTAAGLAELAPGRCTFGIGASAPTIVQQWNGIPFERPFERTRDVVRFLRSALAGERIDARFDTFEAHGFRLSRPPAVAPQLLLAALRPQMLRLAATEADGAITTWLGAEDLDQVAHALRSAAPPGTNPRLVAWVTVCVDADADAVRAGPTGDRRVSQRAVVRTVPPLARQRSSALAGVGRVAGGRSAGCGRRRQRRAGRSVDHPRHGGALPRTVVGVPRRCRRHRPLRPVRRPRPDEHPPRPRPALNAVSDAWRLLQPRAATTSKLPGGGGRGVRARHRQRALREPGRSRSER